MRDAAVVFQIAAVVFHFAAVVLRIAADEFQILRDDFRELGMRNSAAARGADTPYRWGNS